jgi:hypothetical protein
VKDKSEEKDNAEDPQIRREEENPRARQVKFSVLSFEL